MGLGRYASLLYEGNIIPLFPLLNASGEICLSTHLSHDIQSEKFNFPVDGHNVSGQFDPAFHGFDGFIGVSVPGASRAIDGKVMETTQELTEFPFRIDWNSGTLTAHYIRNVKRIY